MLIVWDKMALVRQFSRFRLRVSPTEKWTFPLAFTRYIQSTLCHGVLCKLLKYSLYASFYPTSAFTNEKIWTVALLVVEYYTGLLFTSGPQKILSLGCILRFCLKEGKRNGNSFAFERTCWNKKAHIVLLMMRYVCDEAEIWDVCLSPAAEITGSLLEHVCKIKEKPCPIYVFIFQINKSLCRFSS